MLSKDPEKMARKFLDDCADCDICRYLMEDTSCLVFPELYRLYDKEVDRRGKVTDEELKHLIELCNFCGLCPCPNIRSDIMKAKHAFVSRDGLKPSIRFLEDVERVARVCGAYPRLTNRLLQSKGSGELVKKLAGIHPQRKVPEFPLESFPVWAKQQGLDVMRAKGEKRVAFFAGCTGQYLFPQVPKAAVEVLRQNGIEVYYSEQKCCGMPSLLEGDGDLTFEFVKFNVGHLIAAVEAGYDIVCSCPTCGYMLKQVMAEGAANAPDTGRHADRLGTVSQGPQATVHKGAGEPSTAKKPIEGLLKDEGYFAAISARHRIAIAAHTYDLGEYLLNLHRTGALDTRFGPINGRMAYYPPCHMREQKIGQPYVELLRLIPEIDLATIEGSFYCCGIAGIMGFKRDFHAVSIEMGSRLMDKIREMDPERLVSDCLSCRIQFNQMVPYRVVHPIEIIWESVSSER
ncbi:heterodisulfide reductase-related iron-sulfur binding cluster [Desulfoferrobacter suflitae]|uniref:heterodisulfide reductase-related iron-sulfur binding cluster n=1 Tax=Desulfoferrobacter suflitae TaxID=2865782 RepID=UPI0021648D16|nr:heterodisulfide reductase-related iron-sulfur binding cluster [Desulfoferrobacter suflitae]MCK8603755.1 heterodisulfide reductase-related iron-sulfur binding cluster [Desulfoferrobacter suflitae]